MVHGAMADPTLDDLLDRSAKGDRAAFRAFYDRTAPRMMAIALRLLGRRDLAEEAVQDAYVSAWQSAGRFDPGHGSAMGWMTTITRRRAIDRLRASPWLVRELPASYEDIAPAANSAEQIALRACLDRLDDRTRFSICLCYLYGLTQQELSDATDAPLGTVKSRLRRGLLALKACLET